MLKLTTYCKVQCNEAEIVATAAVATLKPENAINLAATSTTGKRVILAMDLVLIPDVTILDSGSQLNFISEALQKKLGFTPTKRHQGISGIGESWLKSDRSVVVQIKSKTNGLSVCLEAFVLERIVPPQPITELNIGTGKYQGISSWPIQRSINPKKLIC